MTWNKIYRQWHRRMSKTWVFVDTKWLHISLDQECWVNLLPTFLIFTNKFVITFGWLFWELTIGIYDINNDEL